MPALGIRKGDEGIVRNLELYNDTVFAFVMITYSTNQTRGWVIMDVIRSKYKPHSQPLAAPGTHR